MNTRRAGVGTGGGFGQSPGADEFARGQLAEILLFLRFVAREKDVVRAQRGVGGYDDPDRSIHSRLSWVDVLPSSHRNGVGILIHRFFEAP